MTTPQEDPSDRPTDASPAPAGSPEATTLPDAASTALHLLVGAASLGAETLRAGLRAASNGPPLEPGPDVAPGSTTDALRRSAIRGGSVIGSLGSRGVGVALRTARTAGDLAGAFLPGFVSKSLERTRRRAIDYVNGVGALGREELDRARELSLSRLDETTDALILRLAESPEIREAIRIQSTTATEEAVGSLRSRAIRLDDGLEDAVRRLFGRRPTPATDT